ncbi:Crp/Fnr family transcriptional regulator [Chitinophaga sp. Cy-1792]|uniref:Crp/Fnr family transcriptional regulator n=1 Tax=Chitinophaga sp. Cy-1792 TaxID=2608339 RepID=UPI00141E1619|nr:Crp/Fnr family transcriptional regulator [Chitinophaga sp. Cy-1792]NIG55971.1 Crp/Fnr family transcriptional regulator [Chitinophaga sp. Cy-1792]
MMKKVMITEDMDSENPPINPLSTIDEFIKMQLEDGNLLHAKKKRIIYNEGKSASAIFYILHGKVKTSKWNEDGKELITGLYKEGDFFGFHALMQGGRYRETAEVIEEADLVAISRDDLSMLCQHNTTFLLDIIQILTSNIADKQEQMLRMAYSSLRKKVGEALLLTYQKYNPSKAIEFSLNISRCNLAALAGVAKESLIRTLSDLRDERIINIQDGKIIILDHHKLERIIYSDDIRSQE